MKKRLLATVCSAAILANMVPYQAFADDVQQATPETAQTYVQESDAAVFADSRQTAPYNYTMKVKVSKISGDDSVYIKAGDQVKATITISGADWATDANKAGLIAMALELKFDNSIFTPSLRSQKLGEAFATLPEPAYEGYSLRVNTTTDSVVFLIEAPDPVQIDDENPDIRQAVYADLSADDTVVAEYTFTAKKTLPADIENDLTFELAGGEMDDSDIGKGGDSAFGDFTGKGGTDIFVDTVCTYEKDTSLKVDTKAPVAAVDTAEEPAADGTFYYAPVKVNVTESGSGLASVKLGDKELGTAGSYELTEGGTLTVTDTCGNASTLEVKIDTSLLDAAKAAIAKLPDSDPDYSCKADLEDAESTVAALNDKGGAATKLTKAETDKVAAARAAVNAIEDEIKAAEQAIAALPSDIQPTQATIAQVSEVKDQLDKLTAKGVDVEKAVSNYQTYAAAAKTLQAALDEIDAVKKSISADALADKNYKNKDEIAKLEADVAALQKKYGSDILSEDDQAALKAARAHIDEVQAAIDAVYDSNISKLPTALNPLSEAKAAADAADKAVADLVKQYPDASAADVKDYSKLTALKADIAKADAEVDELVADVAAFTYTDYSNKADVEALEARAADLKKTYGDDVLDDKDLSNLSAARKKIADTESAIQAVEDTIKSAAKTALNPLSDAKTAAATARAAVESLLEANPGVTTDNIANYSDLTAFENSVAEADEAVAKLADKIDGFVYGGYNTDGLRGVTDLRKEVTDMQTAYGDDVLTAEQLKKLTDAEDMIAKTPAAIKNANDLIAKLPADPEKIEPTTENIQLVSNIQSAVRDLENLKVDPAANVEGYDNYLKASKALDAAMTRINDVKDQLDKIAYVTYGDSAESIRKLDSEVEKLKADYGDSILTASDLTKLDAAKAALAKTEARINAVIDDIAKLPTETVKLADYDAVESTVNEVKDLMDTEKVPQAEITNYDDCQKAAAAKAATEKAIEAVKAQIEALPEKITLEQSVVDQIYAAKAAAKDVQDTYGDDQHQALDDATLAKLKKANGDLETLTVKFGNLVQDIDTMVNAEDVTLNDKADIEGLRERVDKMVEEDKATFDAAEMNRLTAAEEALAALQTRSNKAHTAVADLAGKDTIKLTDKQAIADLETEIAYMESKGDTFTAAEKQKIEDAKAGIQALEEAADAMKERMTKLPAAEDVAYADNAAGKQLADDIKALEDRGVTVDKTTMGDEAWGAYEAYTKAIDAMNADLTGLNDKMKTQMDSWSYPYDAAAYDALRKQMDDAAEKYGMNEADKAAVFTAYNADKTLAEAAEEKIKQANDKIEALPAEITTAQQKDVDAITALLNELKAAPYNMTDEAVQDALGSNYKTYTDAVAKLAELNKPTPTPVPATPTPAPATPTPAPATPTPSPAPTNTPAPTATPAPANSNSSNNSNSSSSSSSSTTNTAAVAKPAATPTAAPATATRIPQTSDAFPLTALITLAVASLGGFIAVLFKKKRND